jgi:hypothetical protein
MPFHPEMRWFARSLQTEIIGLIGPAPGISRTKEQLLALGYTVLAQCGGPLAVRHRGKQIRGKIGVAARGCRSSSSFETKVADRTRIVGNLTSCHFAHKPRGADARHLHTFFRTNVSHGTSVAVGLRVYRIVRSCRTQGILSGEKTI